MGEETINVRFKFFQITYSSDFKGDLPSLLDNQLSIPSDERIRFSINGVDRVLLDATYISPSGYKAWLFSSKRMRGLPTKLCADGSRKSLNLEDDEGLGEDMAIACDNKGKVAAIQSNQINMQCPKKLWQR